MGRHGGICLAEWQPVRCELKKKPDSDKCEANARQDNVSTTKRLDLAVVVSDSLPFVVYGSRIFDAKRDAGLQVWLWWTPDKDERDAQYTENESNCICCLRCHRSLGLFRLTCEYADNLDGYPSVLDSKSDFVSFLRDSLPRV